MALLEFKPYLSFINQARCAAMLNIIAFCREYDLNIWELLINYYVQFTDLEL